MFFLPQNAVQSKYDKDFKIVLVGDAAVGKSALSECLKNEKPQTEDTQPTDTIEPSIKFFRKNEEKFKIQLWDTGGREVFRSITFTYYSNANGFILAFDLTNRPSFENLEYWLHRIEENANSDQFKILLIGCKCDLNDNIKITPDEINRFIGNNPRIIGYQPTSAKNNTNVLEAFQLLTEQLITSCSPIPTKPGCTCF